MPATHQENVSSFEAILNSIKYDPEVCRWFEFFVTQPAVMEELFSDPSMGREYRVVKDAILKQRILFAAAMISILLVMIFQVMWVFLVVPVVVYFWIRLKKLKTKSVAAISEALISRDYSPKEILSNITLYQLCEQYSKKYGIASLVDKIYCFDQVKRRSVIVFLMIVIGIWTVAFSWKAALAMLCYYELIKAAAMTAAVYRHLR